MKQRFEATRFAPSPTGPLHFGSLVCAVASFILARQYNAKWLIRIEDVDTQRCKHKFIESIINCLHAHGMREDDAIVLQSERDAIYDHYLQTLSKKGLIYACDCSRKMVKSRADYYDGFCRQRNLKSKGNALRFKNLSCQQSFIDMHYGKQQTSMQVAEEDPVLRRADKQYNYNLAVIADDIEQGVDLVVRGADLLDQTPLHQQLFTHLESKVPTFFHIPIAVHSAGVKYAKQSYSSAIENDKSHQNIVSCLIFLGFKHEEIPMNTDVSDLLAWAVNHWQPDKLTRSKEIAVNLSNGVYSL